MTILDEVEQKGFQKGFQMGFQQGFQQGINIAKLWLQNVPIPKIAESVGLPVEDVEKLFADFEEK